MSFADQLRNAKTDEEKRKAAEEQKRQVQLAKMWEDMLDEVFEKIKAECLRVAKAGGKKEDIRLEEIYGKLTGNRGFSDTPRAESDSKWVEMLFYRYFCYTKYGNTRPRYCFSAEDRDSVISGLTARCRKEGLSVTSECKEEEVFSLGTKKVRPQSIWETLNLPKRAEGPDEYGYYTVPAKVKTGTRYAITLTISW